MVVQTLPFLFRVSKKSIHLTLLFSCMIFGTTLLSGCGEEPKRALIFNASPGVEFVLVTQQEGALILNPSQPDSKTQLNLNRKFRLCFHIDELMPDGNALTTVDIELARMPPLQRRLNRVLTGQSFQILLNPQGKVLEVRGGNALREYAKENVILTEAFDKPAFKEGLWKAISDDALTSWVEPVLYVWPVMPVTSGTTWERDPLHLPDGDTILSTSFTLQTMNEQAAQIEVHGTLESGPAGTADVSGVERGVLTLSPTKGHPSSYRASRTLKGEIKTGNEWVPVEATLDIQVDRLER